MEQQVYQKIKAVHGDQFGHGGIQRTINLLTQKKQHWRGMRKDVRDFIERCPCCQKLNRMKIRNNINPFTLASTNVMERIAIDTIGPIEEGQGKYKFVIVIIDAFTRYTKLYPAESTKAEHALPAILDWISQWLPIRNRFRQWNTIREQANRSIHTSSRNRACNHSCI